MAADVEDFASLAKDLQSLEVTPAPGQSLAETAAEFTSRTAVETRTRAERLRQQVEAQSAADKAQIEAQIESLRQELWRKQADAKALLEPLQAKVAMLNEQVWTMGLYLGTGENIVTLAEGDRTASESPLVLRQQVMYMDEESAIATARDGEGIDFRDIEEFDRWLTGDPANRDQVIPEPKAVVALSPRRHPKEHEDAWLSATAAEEDSWTYFLIRNGENLWRLRTDFRVGRHMMPTSTEFTDLFSTRDGRTLEPGSRGWDEAEKRQGALQRHYMRMALVLQGLVDRTTVFHPLPRQGLNLLSQETFDSGRVQLIADAEASLTDGRPGFRQWLAALNARLEPGMRIMGNFASKSFREDAEGEVSKDGYFFDPGHRMPGRSKQDHWAGEWPKSGVIYETSTKTDLLHGEQALVFTFPAEQERWLRVDHGHYTSEELRVPDKRIKVLLARTDPFIIPIDLADPDDIRYYLTSRVNRSQYQSLVPLLACAAEAIEAERKAEAPFRALIAEHLASDHPGHDRASIEAHVQSLVTWYKTGNRVHRALVTGGPDEAKALRRIRAEYTQRTRHGDADDRVVAAILAEHSDAIAVGRFPNGTYRVLTPSPASLPYGGGEERLWVDEHAYTKTGRRRPSALCTTIGTQWARATLVHETADWVDWRRSPGNGLFTDEQVLVLVRQALDRFREEHGQGVAVPAYGFTESDWRLGEVRPLAVCWDRRNSQVLVYAAGESSHETVVEVTYRTLNGELRSGRGQVRGRVHWTTQDGFDGQVPWGGYWGSIHVTPVPVWVDTDVLAVAQVAETKKAQQRRADQELTRAAGAVINHLGGLAEAEWLQRKRAEFDTQFNDPSLWEGHAKTLTRPSGVRAVPDQWRGPIAAWMREHGTDVAGVSLGQVLDAAGVSPDDVEASGREHWLLAPEHPKEN